MLGRSVGSVRLQASGDAGIWYEAPRKATRALAIGRRGCRHGGQRQRLGDVGGSRFADRFRNLRFESLTYQRYVTGRRGYTRNEKKTHVSDVHNYRNRSGPRRVWRIFAGTHFYNSGEAQREGDDSCYFTESCPVLNVTLFSRQ